jgi:UDP-glucose 4-epimerase
MKALVTGAAGFVGSHLCEHLLAAGDEVRGVDAFTEYYPRWQKEENISAALGRDGFTFVEGDLAEMPLAPLLDDVDVVYHLAGQPGVRSSWGLDFSSYVQRNILATQQLLEACRMRPPAKLVYASSSSVYGDAASYPVSESVCPRPVSPYGVTKLSAEQLCHLYFVNYRVPTASMRYFTVYGPRQRPDMGFHRFFLAAMRNEPITVFGDGRQTRDFTFVSDAVAATVAASTRGTPGAVYNIGGGSRVELLDVFELIGRITGRPLRLNMTAPQAGDMRDTYADTARARTDLGFAPSVTLEQGLRAQFQWMTEAGLFNA